MYDWLSLRSKLVAAARANPPADTVPYAFEKRVMALLAARVAKDQLAMWVRGLWRAAASCVALALLLGLWIWFSPASSTSGDDLSQNFESTLLASVDQSD